MIRTNNNFVTFVKPVYPAKGSFCKPAVKFSYVGRSQVETKQVVAELQAENTPQPTPSLFLNFAKIIFPKHRLVIEPEYEEFSSCCHPFSL